MEKWKTKKTEKLIETHWVKVRRDAVELPNGQAIGSNGDGGGFMITTEYIVGAAGNHSAAHNPHISIAIVDPACEKIP